MPQDSRVKHLMLDPCELALEFRDDGLTFDSFGVRNKPSRDLPLGNSGHIETGEFSPVNGDRVHGGILSSQSVARPSPMALSRG